MRGLSKWLVLFVVWQMTPGAGEVLENAVRLVETGHLAHARPNDGHQPQDPEHDCSGPFHVCACHRSTVFIPADVDPQTTALAVQTVTFPQGDSLLMTGTHAQVFRAPIAL